MDYLEDNKFKDFVKDAIIDKLEGMKGWGEQHYCCDLAYALFESENVNGAYYCSTWQAKQTIKKYFDDLGEVVEEITSEFDKDFVTRFTTDIFDNPDRFLVVCVLEVAIYLLSQCKTVEENWGDEITLNDEMIKKLKKELKEV